MKPQHPFIILALTLCLSQAGFAQNNNENKKLLGTWVLDYDATKSVMTTKAIEIFNSMSISQKASVELAYVNRQISFDSQGNGNILIQNGHSVNFSWIYDPQLDILTLTNSENRIQTFNVLTLTPNQLSLKVGLSNSGTNTIMFPELTFIKI